MVSITAKESQVNRDIRGAQGKLYEDIQERCALVARSNHDAFCEYVIRDPLTGLPIEFADIHREWHRFDEYATSINKFPQILAPSDHGKTTDIIGDILDDIGKSPNIRIGLLSNTPDNASRKLSTVKMYIENSREYHRVYPHIIPSTTEDNWGSYEITVERKVPCPDPTVSALGIMSAGGNKRFDKIYFDDIVDVKTTILEPIRIPTVIELFYNNWIPRLEPTGRAKSIATTWTEKDIIAVLKKNPKWVCMVQGISKDFEYIDQVNLHTGEKKRIDLFQKKWNKEMLIDRRSGMIASAFDRTMRNIPVSDDTKFFPSFMKCVRYDLKISDLVRQEYPHYIGVDLSGKNRPGTIIYVMAVLPDGRRCRVDIMRGAWKSPEIIDNIILAYNKYKAEVVFVENNATQDMVIDWLSQRNRSIPVKGFTTGKNKADPSVGLPSMEIEFENRGWVFPMGDQVHEVNCSCNFCEEILETEGYPYAADNDVVMGRWFAREAHRLGGNFDSFFRVVVDTYTKKGIEEKPKTIDGVEPETYENVCHAIEFYNLNQGYVDLESVIIWLKGHYNIAGIPIPTIEKILVQEGFCESPVKGQYVKAKKEKEKK